MSINTFVMQKSTALYIVYAAPKESTSLKTHTVITAEIMNVKEKHPSENRCFIAENSLQFTEKLVYRLVYFGVPKLQFLA